MTGILFSDYYLVRKRLLKLTDLFERSPRSIYWYWKGFNWRALAAWVVGVWISLPGFAEYVRYSTARELKGWSNIYDLSYFVGFLLSIVTYYVLNWLWPVNGLGVVDDADYFGTFASTSPTIVEAVPVDDVPVDVDKAGTLASSTEKMGDVSYSPLDI